jgi:molybdopterin converting factor small subunit
MDVQVTLYGPLRGVTGAKTVEVSVESADPTDADEPAETAETDRVDEDGSRPRDGADGVQRRSTPTDEPTPTVGDVVRAFVAAYPRSRDQLLTDEGAIRPSVRVLCDGDRRELSAPATDEMGLFPAMRGG